MVPHAQLIVVLVGTVGQLPLATSQLSLCLARGAGQTTSHCTPIVVKQKANRT
jgi:hypothetical protein